MPQTMELPPAYESPLDVNPLKVRDGDVLNLVEYLEYPKHKEYYQNILVAKTGPSASCEDYETDNDDSSEGCEDFWRMYYFCLNKSLLIKLFLMFLL